MHANNTLFVWEKSCMKNTVYSGKYCIKLDLEVPSKIYQRSDIKVSCLFLSILVLVQL